jgi:hypothetical protein
MGQRMGRRACEKQSRHIASGEGDETSRSAVRWVETRGSGIGSRAPFDRRSGHHDPWIRPWTPQGPTGTRPPAPASPRRRGVGKTSHEGSRARATKSRAARGGRGGTTMQAKDEYRAWRSPCAPSAACGLPSERSRPRSTRPAPWSRRRWATRSVVARRIGSTPFGLNGTDRTMILDGASKNQWGLFPGRGRQ